MTRYERVRGASWAAWSLLVASGCASSNRTDALDAYATALRDQHDEAAYNLLTDELRRGHSLAAFRELFSDRELARDASRSFASMHVTGESATLSAANGDTVRLIEANGWHLDLGSIERYPRDTPRRTVESLLRAIERRRYDVLVAFAPEMHRDHLDAQALRSRWGGGNEEELRTFVLVVRAALAANRIDVTADRAVLPHAKGALKLVLEGDEWKVDAFE